MVVHKLVVALGATEMPRIFVVRYPHKVSKSRESIFEQ
jgi:hypothetical protein